MILVDVSTVDVRYDPSGRLVIFARDASGNEQVIARLRQGHGETDAPEIIRALRAYIRQLETALLRHRHTDECLAYAAQTGKPYCIARCADSWREATRQVTAS